VAGEGKRDLKYAVEDMEAVSDCVAEVDGDTESEAVKVGLNEMVWVAEAVADIEGVIEIEGVDDFDSEADADIDLDVVEVGVHEMLFDTEGILVAVKDVEGVTEMVRVRFLV